MLINRELINKIEEEGGAYHFALAKNLILINRLYRLDNDSVLIKIENVLQLLQQKVDISEEISLKVSRLLAEVRETKRMIGSDLDNISITRFSETLVVILESVCKASAAEERQNILVVCGQDVTVNVIEKSLKVYRSYFGNSDLGPPEEYLALHQHNPDMYFYAVDPKTNEVVGNLEIIPFEEDYLTEYEQGKHDEEFYNGSYPLNKISQYKIPGIYSLVVELIAIEQQYAGYREVLKMLLSTFIDKLLSLSQDDIYIRNVYTDVYTTDGKKLAEYFGFRKVRDTVSGELYKTSLLPPTFTSLFPANVEELRTKYSNRFQQYEFLLTSSHLPTPATQAAPRSVKKRKYSVGLSFSGNERRYVEMVAAQLINLNVRVFYDEFEKVSLWGKDLYQYLNSVYKNDCDFCVVFISKSYLEKLWTKHEIKSVQARAFVDDSEYLLPVKMDDTEIPGLNLTVGYINGKTTPPEELANLIFKKINQ